MALQVTVGWLGIARRGRRGTSRPWGTVGVLLERKGEEGFALTGSCRDSVAAVWLLLMIESAFCWMVARSSRLGAPDGGWREVRRMAPYTPAVPANCQALGR